MTYVMEVGFVPEPPQVYGITALVAREPHMHRLQGHRKLAATFDGLHDVLALAMAYELSMAWYSLTRKWKERKKEKKKEKTSSSRQDYLMNISHEV